MIFFLLHRKMLIRVVYKDLYKSYCDLYKYNFDQFYQIMHQASLSFADEMLPSWVAKKLKKRAAKKVKSKFGIIS